MGAEIRPETVLIVDDDDDLRDLTDLIVTRGGYQTTLAKNPASAISIIRDNPGLGFLLTELHMPGAEFDGIELARQAKVIQPSIHTVLLSLVEITSVHRMRFPGAVDTSLDKFEIAGRLLPEMEALRGPNVSTAMSHS